MRLNFRKVSAIAASALMVGMTMGVAAASSYPAPFVTGSGADVAIVYGTGSGVSSLDLVQAGNLQGNLQSYMGTSSGSSSTTVSGGDSKILSTSTRKLYYGDHIAAPIPTLTYTELGSVLASGSVTDLAGTAYGYTQTVVVGPATINYGTSGGDINDPILYIDSTTTAGNLYNYTLSFTKNINVSDATNVQGQKVKIQGVDYVIGASSTNTTLYLYGSGNTVTVNGGESATVDVAGTVHTVELITTSSTTGTIKVDGVSKTVTEGSNYAFAGGINIYVKDVIHPAYAGDLRQIELIVGASSLKLVSGQTVKKGADETGIQGTNAVVTGAGVGIISGFNIEIAAAKSQLDSIALGEFFTDPVFGGLKVSLANVVPTLDSAARGKIIADAGSSNTQAAYVTFTSARAGSAGEQKLQYVYDNNTASTAVQPLLAHSTQPSSNGRGIIHVLEGENAVLNDWIIVNQGDSGTILQVDSLDNKGDGLTGTVTLSDVITGESQTLTLTNGTTGFTAVVNAWGGTGYTISTSNANAAAAWTTVNITWSTAGTRTLFPRIKLANGGWLALLKSTTLVNGSTVILPDGVTTLTTTGVSLANETTPIVYNSGIAWNVSNSSAGNVIVRGIVYPTCNFNATLGPALLYMEPKKWDDSTYGDFVCIPLTTTGTTQMAMGDPALNGSNSGWITLGSDTYKKTAVDEYGLYATKEDRTNQNGLATIYYPSSQMYFDVVFSAVGASITGGTAPVPGGQLGDVLVKDSEVSSVSSKNLLVVGGSCINSVAASLLGAGCTSDFTAKTGVGSGQFLIQSLASPYSSSKVALVVAGYEAADTVNAATYLRTQTVDTAVGKKYKGTSASSATLVVA